MYSVLCCSSVSYCHSSVLDHSIFFFQAEDGIRDTSVTGVQTCALPILVMVLDVATGESRKLTTHQAFEGYATFSPDGSRVSYWYPRDGDPNNVNDIRVTAVTGGDGTDETRAVDRNLVRAVWMPDGKSLLVGGHDGTRTALWLLPLGGAAKRLDLGDVSPSWGFWS